VFPHNHVAVKKAIEEREGCRVEGSFDIKKVPGNFHLSLHGFEDLVFFLTPGELSRLAFSHTQHQLEFGIIEDNREIQERFGVGDHSRFAPFDGLA
jgi:hypothetical protein